MAHMPIGGSLMERVDYQSIVIQDIINLHSTDELALNPWYQRRSVWTRPQKAYLINTLLEQKPVPTIYIRHGLDLDQFRLYVAGSPVESTYELRRHLQAVC